jgi:hypothetical protein
MQEKVKKVKLDDAHEVELISDGPLTTVGETICRALKPVLGSQVGWIIFLDDSGDSFDFDPRVTPYRPHETQLAYLYSDGVFRGAVSPSPDMTESAWQALTRSVWKCM